MNKSYKVRSSQQGQLGLDFGAAERERERLAARPEKRYARRDAILAAAITDGFDNQGKRVSASTLRLVLLAINSFGDDCHAATKTIARRCGDPEWQTLVPRPEKLSDRTVKSAIQALYRASPELLDRTNKGKRRETRRILWQYLKPSIGELGPRIGEPGSRIGEPSSSQLEETNPSKRNCADIGAVGADGALIESLRGKANLFAGIFDCRDELLRERVLRVCSLWHTGRLPAEICDDVLRELKAIKRRDRIRDPRALLFRLFRDRGYDLDRMLAAVPSALMVPPNKPEANCRSVRMSEGERGKTLGATQ